MGKYAAIWMNLSANNRPPIDVSQILAPELCLWIEKEKMDEFVAENENLSEEDRFGESFIGTGGRYLKNTVNFVTNL